MFNSKNVIVNYLNKDFNKNVGLKYFLFFYSFLNYYYFLELIKYNNINENNFTYNIILLYLISNSMPLLCLVS